MALSRKQTALIHVAKKQLALEDGDYRAILRQEAGVESSRALDADGFKSVLRRFGELGFTPGSKRPDLGHRYGMASPEQAAFIISLWKQYTKGEGDDRSPGQMATAHRQGLRYQVRHLRHGLQGDHGLAGDGEAGGGMTTPRLHSAGQKRIN